MREPLSIPQFITKAGLYLFALSLPVSHVPAQFGIGLAVLGWLTDGLVNNKWRVVRHPFLGFLAFYLAWNIIAAVLSPRPLHSLNAVGDNEWPLLIMLMMFWTIDDAQVLRKIVLVYFVASAVAMVYAIWQTFGGIELYRNLTLDWMGGYYRAVGFYGFYLTFAAFAMSVFFLALAYAFETSRHRILHTALAAAAFLAIVGSFARSIWLSLAIGIPAFGFLKNKKFGLIICTGLLVVIIAGIAIEPAIRYRAESILEPGQNQTRLNLWKTSVNIAHARPIFGGGEDNFDYFFPIYSVEGYYDTTVHPHNDYLTVLVASGIPGLLAFVGMWLISLRAGYRVWKRSERPEIKAIALGSALSLFGFLIGSFFQNYYGTFVNCLGWWFVVGLILTANRLCRQESADSAQSSS